MILQSHDTLSLLTDRKQIEISNQPHYYTKMFEVNFPNIAFLRIPRKHVVSTFLEEIRLGKLFYF